MTKSIKIGDKVRLNERGRSAACSMTVTDQAKTYTVVDYFTRSGLFELSDLPSRRFKEVWLELAYEYDVNEWSID